VSSCSEWARLIMHYPVGAAEAYSFDEQGGLTVKNDYKYVSFKNALGAPVAPIPPFVRMARLSGYPVEINGLIVETRYPTHYGMLDYVTGEELTYKIPACSYVDKTLAPVRVEELKEALPVEKALMAILLEPRWIWPGDHDYLPDDVMDTMHNLRLLAWATWSLSEKSRKRCIRELARPGLEKINENNYIFFKDPVASATYARDSTIFAQRGKTSYDSDWYNGFQLAGLWAYRYFGDRDAGLELTRSHWPLWTALRNYMEIYHDWATCSSTTDPRGNLTDYDCMRNGWAGLLAFARLARDTGKQDLYFQTKYLASKTMVALYVQWTLQEYFYDLAASFAPDSGKGLLRYKRDEITGIDRIDAYSSHSFTLPDNQAPYNLSACIPEHSLFLSDYGLLDRVRKLTYDLMPRHFPDWSKFDPAGIKGSGDWTSANAAAGRYFYFLDPHLFVRAINFNEPLAQLLSYRPLDWLSGQIIEAMLVGSRPMLIMPTNAEFFGNTWNNRERSLTFTLEGNGLADLEIWNCIRPQKISPDAVMRYDAQKRTAYLQIELKGREKTKVFF